MVLDTSTLVAVLFDAPERHELVRAIADARAGGEELVFKGDDFARTDIAAAARSMG